MPWLRERVDSKGKRITAVLKIELGNPALNMSGQSLVRKAESLLLLKNRANPHGKLQANAETNRRHNRSLQDDISNLHPPSRGLPLRLKTHDARREDVVTKKKVGTPVANRPAHT